MRKKKIPISVNISSHSVRMNDNFPNRSWWIACITHIPEWQLIYVHSISFNSHILYFIFPPRSFCLIKYIKKNARNSNFFFFADVDKQIAFSLSFYCLEFVMKCTFMMTAQWKKKKENTQLLEKIKENWNGYFSLWKSPYHCCNTQNCERRKLMSLHHTL